MSLSTRRGFIAASGFGAHDGHDARKESGGHGGHAGEAGGPGRDEFRKLADAFIDQSRLADGSVQPRASEVYLMAMQWAYLPGVLRLQTGVPYRFRMMAMDSTHGAAIALGSGSRIIRLRPGVLVEQELTFKRPGEYLVYCTVYCGLPHDRMQGKIIVADAGPQQAVPEHPTGHKH